jgi:hypothetical protein
MPTRHGVRKLPRWATGPRVRVVLKLLPVDHLLLKAMVQGMGQTEADVIADALKCLFVHAPRPGDGEPAQAGKEKR